MQLDTSPQEGQKHKVKQAQSNLAAVHVSQIYKEPNEQKLDLYFDGMQMAGAPVMCTYNWDKTRIDFVVESVWGRAEILPVGFYTTDGKLQGEWLSFDMKGKKTVSANYDNGKKVGKWFYWNDKTLKEVDYSNNAIANVNEWSNKSTVAIRD